MPRQRKSTRDQFLDDFADFDLGSQESLIDTCELIHRQAKRRASRGKDEDSIEARADAEKAKAEAAKADAAKLATGQQSLSGLPDEDQKL